MPFNNASEGNYDDDNGEFEENVPDTGRMTIIRNSLRDSRRI